MVIVLAVGFWVWRSIISITQPVSALPDNTSTFSTQKLWNMIQTYRRDNNLQEFEADEGLCAIATDRADDGPDEHKGFLEKYASKYPYVISENMVGAPYEEAALKQWTDSASHSAALRGNYRYSCLSCAPGFMGTDGKPLTSCVQIFSNLQ